MKQIYMQTKLHQSSLFQGLHGTCINSPCSPRFSFLTEALFNSLGVGANPNLSVHTAASPSLNEVKRRLGNAIRRQVRAEAQLHLHSDSGTDDELESRSKIIGNKPPSATNVMHIKSNKLNNCLQRDHIENSKSHHNQHILDIAANDVHSSEEEWGDDMLQRVLREQKIAFEKWSNGFVSVKDTKPIFNSNRGLSLKRKKKKIRSRQKNLRRDKRLPHQLPSHFNEQTLLTGRMQRNDSTTHNHQKAALEIPK